jgi:hypothetical protein
MMTDQRPTRVVLYSYANGLTARPVAEFRWSPESGVSLVVHDVAQSRLAADYYANGMRSERDGRVVPAAEGPAFMRALLEPKLMTYSRFVDETPERAGAGPSRPSRNAVGFQLRRGGDAGSAVAEAPIQDGDCVERAWEIVRQAHRASADEVSRVYCVWEPSEHDKQFVARTFPGADLDYRFGRAGSRTQPEAPRETRPAARQRDHDPLAPVRQMEADEGVPLLPILCGPSSGRGAAMLMMPLVRQPLVPDRVHVGLGLAGQAPHGRFGVSWLMQRRYQELGEPPFADLLRHASANLTRGLEIDFVRLDGGDDSYLLRLRRERMASSAAAMPGFYERMSSELRADRLVVGIPCVDELLVADADSATYAAEVEGLTANDEHAVGFLGPTVLLMDRTGIRLLADRHV